MRHIPAQLLYHQSTAPNIYITSVCLKSRPHHVAWVTSRSFPALHVICICCWAQHSFIFWRRFFGLSSLSHFPNSICHNHPPIYFTLKQTSFPYSSSHLSSLSLHSMCHFIFSSSLSVLAKQLWKATKTTSCLSVCSSIWTEQLPQSAFHWNFVIDIVFPKIC
jgi:hypothetical protein